MQEQTPHGRAFQKYYITYSKYAKVIELNNQQDWRFQAI